jgi:hypothetical protein
MEVYPRMNSPDFRAVVPHLDRYLASLPTEVLHHLNPDLNEECRKRLRQLAACIACVTGLCAQFEANQETISARGYLPNTDIPQLARSTFGDLMDEIERETEGFYHTAWRLLLVLRPLPSMRGLDPPGVRNVRNSLIVHPDRHDRIFANSFGYESGKGPIIKPQPTGADRFFDAGLWPNASELHEHIIRRLT